MKEGILFLYLERQFRELPQVVPGGQLWVENGHRAPGQLPLSVVEGQWHRRHLNSIKLTISVSEFLPVCLCCRPCSSDGMCASGSRYNGKASGYLNKMKWRQKKTNLLHRCQGSSRTCRSGSRGSPCRPRSTWQLCIVSEDNSLPFLGRMFELLVIVVDDLKVC